MGFHGRMQTDEEALLLCLCANPASFTNTHIFPWRCFAVWVCGKTLRDATPSSFMTHNWLICVRAFRWLSLPVCVSDVVTAEKVYRLPCVCYILTSLLPALCLKARFRGSDTSALVVVIMPSPSGAASHGVSWTMYVHFFSNSVSVHVLMSVSSISTSTSVSVNVSAPSDSMLVAVEAILGCVSSCSMVCAPSLVNVAELWEVAFTRRTQKEKFVIFGSVESQRAKVELRFKKKKKKKRKTKNQNSSKESKIQLKPKYKEGCVEIRNKNEKNKNKGDTISDEIRKAKQKERQISDYCVVTQRKESLMLMSHTGTHTQRNGQETTRLVNHLD